jgi:haloalkane dehalogenase
MMQIRRTPDDRFEGLQEWSFKPHYAMITDAAGDQLRLAYYDEGPRGGRTVLLMHGEPSWSYLYRKIIPLLVANGRRVVAPDLIGFGRSDKPASRSDFTYERHVAWMSQWLTSLDLRDVTLFCQDWGGLIGLRLVAAFPERFAGLVVANTGLPVGTGFSEGFQTWLTFSQSTPQFPVGMIVSRGTSRGLSDAEVAAYDAPFPDESFKEGARQFPTLVPITPQHGSVKENIAAWGVLQTFNKPVVTAFSDNDPVTKGGDVQFHKRVPGTNGQPHETLSGGHFLQEDCPSDVVRMIEGILLRTGA